MPGSVARSITADRSFGGEAVVDQLFRDGGRGHDAHEDDERAPLAGEAGPVLIA